MVLKEGTSHKMMLSAERDSIIFFIGLYFNS